MKWEIEVTQDEERDTHRQQRAARRELSPATAVKSTGRNNGI